MKMNTSLEQHTWCGFLWRVHRKFKVSRPEYCRKRINAIFNLNEENLNYKEAWYIMLDQFTRNICFESEILSETKIIFKCCWDTCGFRSSVDMQIITNIDISLPSLFNDVHPITHQSKMLTDPTVKGEGGGGSLSK